MNGSEASLKSRYAFKLAANIVNGLVNVVTVSLVPRALGAFDYGVFSYLQQFYLQATNFLDSGSSLAFFTKLSADSTRKELLAFYARYSLVVFGLLLVLTAILRHFEFGSFLLPGIPKDYLYWGMSLGFGVWFTQVIISISDANAMTRKTEMLKIGHRLIVLILVLSLWLLGLLKLSSFYMVQVLALSLFILLSVRTLKRLGIISPQTLTSSVNHLEIIHEFFSFMAPLIASSIFCGFAGMLELWLLQSISGSVEVGYYGIAFQIACLCFIFTSAMTPVISREFSKNYAQGNLETIRTLLQLYLPMLHSISAFFGVFIAFQSKNIVMLFAGAEFFAAWPAVATMALYPVHQTYGQLCGAVFYAAGKTAAYRNVLLLGSLSGVAVSVIALFLLKLGAAGLAAKTVLSQIILVNILLVYCCKDLQLSPKPFFKHQIASLLFFVSLGYLSTLASFENRVVEVFFAALVYCLSCGLLVLWKAGWVFAIPQSKLRKNFFSLFK